MCNDCICFNWSPPHGYLLLSIFTFPLRFNLSMLFSFFFYALYFLPPKIYVDVVFSFMLLSSVFSPHCSCCLSLLRYTSFWLSWSWQSAFRLLSKPPPPCSPRASPRYCSAAGWSLCSCDLSVWGPEPSLRLPFSWFLMSTSILRCDQTQGFNPVTVHLCGA